MSQASTLNPFLGILAYNMSRMTTSLDRYPYSPPDFRNYSSAPQLHKSMGALFNTTTPESHVSHEQLLHPSCDLSPGASQGFPDNLTAFDHIQGPGRTFTCHLPPPGPMPLGMFSQLPLPPPHLGLPFFCPPPPIHSHGFHPYGVHPQILPPPHLLPSRGPIQSPNRRRFRRQDREQRDHGRAKGQAIGVETHGGTGKSCSKDPDPRPSSTNPQSRSTDGTISHEGQRSRSDIASQPCSTPLTLPENRSPIYQCATTVTDNATGGPGGQSKTAGPGGNTSSGSQGTPSRTWSGGRARDFNVNHSIESSVEDERAATPNAASILKRPRTRGTGRVVSKQRSGGPPPNAPTQPASLRAMTNGSKGAPQASLPQRRPDTGMWSQSKRWVSQEAKERAAFQKLMQNLHYMGANNSPFIPQTAAALTEFRIAQAESKSRMLRKRVDDMSRRRQLEESSAEEAGSDLKPLLLGGRCPRDSLSPFFAQNSCFNKDQDSDVPPKVEWPSLAELKEEGDRRAARYGRYLPLPRLNVVASPFLQRGRGKAYNSDGSISWDKKAVKPVCRFIRPVTEEAESLCCESCELELHELHEPLRAFLKEINESDITSRCVEQREHPGIA